MTVQECVQQFRSSPLIKERQFGDVSSFNFTRRAFYDGTWNDCTVKARGMFIDTAQNKIVARGYEKFFNIGEVFATTKDSLRNNLEYPLTIYGKENGFLGLLSVYQGELFYATKSMCDRAEKDNRYVEIFKRVVEDSNLNMDAIKSYLRGGNFTLVFEVIDPISDPHIISYPMRQLFLLDVLYNDVRFEKLPYHIVATTLAPEFGVKTKKCYGIIRNFAELDYFLVSCDTLLSECRMEGFVIEDASGFMFKVKLPYYKKWKRYRKLVNDIWQGKEIPESEMTPFLRWASRYLDSLPHRPGDPIPDSIIHLRVHYGFSYHSHDDEKGEEV